MLNVIKKDLEVLEILKKLFPIEIGENKEIYSRTFCVSNVDDDIISKLEEWLNG